MNMTIRKAGDLGLVECRGCGKLVEFELIEESGYGPCCLPLEEEEEDYDADD